MRKIFTDSKNTFIFIPIVFSRRNVIIFRVNLSTHSLHPSLSHSTPTHIHIHKYMQIKHNYGSHRSKALSQMPSAVTLRTQGYIRGGKGPGRGLHWRTPADDSARAPEQRNSTKNPNRLRQKTPAQDSCSGSQQRTPAKTLAKEPNR